MVKWETPKVFSRLSHVSSDIVPRWVWRLGDNLNAIRDFTCRSILSQSAMVACSATITATGLAAAGQGQALGTQEVRHPLLPGVVVCTVEERDKGVDFLVGGHVVGCSRQTKQSALEENNEPRKNDYTMVVDNGDTMPVAK